MPHASSDQPGRRAGTGSYATPIRSCTRWGLPCRARCRPRGALLPHPFDLTRPRSGGMLSVALSLTPEGVAGRYPAPSFRGARTFLAPASSAGPRPPGPLAGEDIGGNARSDESRCFARVSFGWKADSSFFVADLLGSGRFALSGSRPARLFFAVARPTAMRLTQRRMVMSIARRRVAQVRASERMIGGLGAF